MASRLDGISVLPNLQTLSISESRLEWSCPDFFSDPNLKPLNTFQNDYDMFGKVASSWLFKSHFDCIVDKSTGSELAFLFVKEGHPRCSEVSLDCAFS